MFDSSELPSPLSDRAKLLASLIALFALLAVGVSAYVAWASWQSETVAGCSAAGAVDCDQVLGSRWSRWLGMPVALLGLFTYLGILAVCWPAAKRPAGLWGAVLLCLSMLAAGGAIWFIGVQAILLQSFCFYCLGIHLCGLTIAVLTLLLVTGGAQQVDYDQMRALLGVVDEPTSAPGTTEPGPWEGFYPLFAMAAAFVGLSLLIGGQFLFAPQTFVEELAVEAPSLENAEEENQDLAFDEHVAGDDESHDSVEETPGEESLLGAPSRRIVYEGLPEAVRISDYPIVGSPEAPQVFLEMIDYTCEHCRHLHPYIHKTLDRYGDQIAFVIQHVPLSKKCNPNVPRDRPGKQYACDYARLAISVWKLAPDEFQDFHDWLMESEKPPPIVEARQRAIRVAGEEVLLDQGIRADAAARVARQCDVIHQLKIGLPTIMTPQGKIRGVPENDQQWFDFLEQRFGLEPLNAVGEGAPAAAGPGDAAAGSAK